MPKKSGCPVGQRRVKDKCVPDKYIFTGSWDIGKSGKIVIKNGDTVTLLENGKTHNVIRLENGELQAINKGFFDDGDFKKI